MFGLYLLCSRCTIVPLTTFCFFAIDAKLERFILSKNSDASQPEEGNDDEDYIDELPDAESLDGNEGGNISDDAYDSVPDAKK